jgi:hypothetical protein
MFFSSDQKTRLRLPSILVRGEEYYDTGRQPPAGESIRPIQRIFQCTVHSVQGPVRGGWFS